MSPSPPPPLHEVFTELVGELGLLEQRFSADPALTSDEQTEVEAYKWIFSILQVALDCYVWADVDRPRFVDIVGPYKKWGGDNSDAFYQYARLDPSRTYRVTCQKGDAVYLSLTVYGGPNDGRYSERIVGTINDRDTGTGPHGELELWLSPEPHEGNWIRLEPDAVCAITRDYLAEPDRDVRAVWHIEAVDPPPTRRERRDDLVVGLRAALTWIRQQAEIVPLGPGDPNTVDDPYPVPSTTFGWAAGDAAYGMGTFDLADGEALVLRGRSPECVFWSLCLWNPFLHTYDYAYERVTINGTQVALEADGSWTLVVADGAVDHPNAVSTQGHGKGRLWFRWFLPDHTPEPIRAEVVPVAEVAGLPRPAVPAAR
jgi:hypothetical protein